MEELNKVNLSKQLAGRRSKAPRMKENAREGKTKLLIKRLAQSFNRSRHFLASEHETLFTGKAIQAPPMYIAL